METFCPHWFTSLWATELRNKRKLRLCLYHRFHATVAQPACTDPGRLEGLKTVLEEGAARFRGTP